MDYKEEKRIVFTGTDAASKKLDLLFEETCVFQNKVSAALVPRP
jgi:hypothetical protein